MNWIVKTASLLALAAAMLTSCTEKEPQGGSYGVTIDDLGVAFDKNVIRNDGETVTLKAFYKGQDVSDKATFFQYLPGQSLPVQMTSRTFSATEVGQYTFQVSYLTSISNQVTITVVDNDIPARLSDESGSKPFVHRTFLNQHTGAKCGYCPGMTKLLYDTLVEDIKDKAVLCALRTYGGGETGFASVPNPSTGWPFLHIDYAESYAYNKPSEGLKAIIEERTASDALVGISANPVYYESDKQIIVRVTVKAAVKGEYNVGLWLMQDNYYAAQTDNLGIKNSDKTHDYDKHNNGVRIAESKYLGAHIGFPLGQLEAGEKADWVFTFDLKDAIEKTKAKGGWWESFKPEKLDELHFAAFVTTNDGKGKYSVVNAIDFPYNEPTPFECK